MKVRSISARASRAFSKRYKNRIKQAVFLCRNSGRGADLYLEAAGVLLDHGGDVYSFIAVLLVPVVKSGKFSVSFLKRSFGRSADLAVKFISNPFPFNSTTRPDLDRLLGAVGCDVRVLVMRLAVRLVELKSRRGGNVVAVARETLDVLVPIADRMGMNALRKQLEDVSFKIIEPRAYSALARKTAHILAEDQKCLEILIKGVRRLLARHGIRADVRGRTKSLYGIYMKMKRTGAPLKKILDRIGIRIIVSSVPRCYTVLGILHTHFRPIPGTFDDYIGMPKENGYQSLHTCVYPVPNVSKKPVEFQIRTHLMHLEAELGVAAHWKYKSQRAAEVERKRNLLWLRSLRGQHSAARSRGAFIKQLKRQVFGDGMVIFGVGGRVVRMPEGSTVGDFVRRYYGLSDVGRRVRVNGVLRPMSAKLKDGDTVEIGGTGIRSVALPSVAIIS